MSDPYTVFKVIDENNELLEKHRAIPSEETKALLNAYRHAYNDIENPIPDYLNGFMCWDGSMICISCLFGLVFEFGIEEPLNYHRYIGPHYMICPECDAVIQPWKDGEY